ncbi:MAG: DUF4118 domain-containing protein [Flavobacteriales bacterium]|nr:MAG: DUF4118 domain-containing protein [Flavobacteriales bacterium]
MLAEDRTRRSYAIALIAVVMSAVMRGLLDPVMGEGMPYYVFYFAVMVATTFGGIGPGLFSIVASYLVATFFFAPPRLSLDLSGMKDAIGAFRFLTVGTALVLLGGWGRIRLLKWRAEAAERKHNELEALRELERTNTALAALGDGLIITDTAGRVTFMNEVAEQITGRTTSAVHGMEVEDLLPLVNLHTCMPLPNPAAEALRTGAKVTLPEHTSLVGTKGKERLISIHAEPIRDHGQRITGAVVLFRERTPRARQLSIEDVALFPASAAQARLSSESEMALLEELRAWLTTEWRSGLSNVRYLTLHGLQLTVRGEEVAELPEGGVRMRFRVSYQG